MSSGGVVVLVLIVLLIWVWPVQLVYSGEKSSGRRAFEWLAAPVLLGWLGYGVWRGLRNKT